MAYTPREYVKVHYVYSLDNGNARAVATEYETRFSDRNRYSDHNINVHQCI